MEDLVQDGLAGVGWCMCLLVMLLLSLSLSLCVCVCVYSRGKDGSQSVGEIGRGTLVNNGRSRDRNFVNTGVGTGT